MIRTLTQPIVILSVLAASLYPFQPAVADPLPQSTQQMMKELKVDPSILSGLDKELQVPQEWIQGAKKEGQLRWRATPSTQQGLKKLLAPFKERYPFLEIKFHGSNQRDRSIKTLTAYKEGRILADVLTSIGGFIYEYEKADALEDLRSIPNLKNIPEGAKDPKGRWVGIYRLPWCMSYNTRLVKKEDLPKKWEDLTTNPIWRNGNLALGNRPHLWALNLWKAKGETWTKEFLTKLFKQDNPQRRREGAGALVELVAAGEFYAAIPSNNKRAYEAAQIGAPVGWVCPEPVPDSVNDSVILKNAPNIFSAKLFTNWLLSKEGQISMYYSSFSSPIHKDLERKEFLPYADQILGKKISFKDAELERQVGPQLAKYWKGLWLSRD